MTLLVANITAGGPVSLCVFLCEWLFFHSQLETQENMDLFRSTETHWKTLIPIAHVCVCVYIYIYIIGFFSSLGWMDSRQQLISLDLFQFKKHLCSSPILLQLFFSPLLNILAIVIV